MSQLMISNIHRIKIRFEDISDGREITDRLKS